MVAIIVLNYNNPDITKKCIQSIFDNCTGNYSVFLVDNASTDGSYEKFRIWYGNSDIKIIHSPENTGYAAGNNIGAREALCAGASHLLFMNNDIILQNDIVAILLRTLHNSRAVVVGPEIVSPDLKKMVYNRRILDFRSYLLDKKPFVFLHKYLGVANRHYDVSERMLEFNGMVSGSCFMIDAKIFKQIEGFDEGTFLYGEEDILAYKLREIGCICAYQPNAKVVHWHSSTISPQGEAFERYHRYYSALYVLRKYARVSDCQFIIAALINLAPCAVNAICHGDYRLYFRRLFNDYMRLLRC